MEGLNAEQKQAALAAWDAAIYPARATHYLLSAIYAVYAAGIADRIASALPAPPADAEKKT